MECLLSFNSFYSSLLFKNIKIKTYRTTVLLVVFYGCEKWSLTIGEEHRLRMLNNKVLRKIFGPKRKKQTQEWGRLHNEELYYLYSSYTIIWVIKSRRIKWVKHVALLGMGEVHTGF